MTPRQALTIAFLCVLCCALPAYADDHQGGYCLISTETLAGQGVASCGALPVDEHSDAPIQDSSEEPYCFQYAAEKYDVSPELLWSISRFESHHNPSAVHVNTNGSYDYGHMQINSSWAKVIGLDRWKQLSDPCYNTQVGAWILSQCIGKYGYTWQAVGCYNSQKTKEHQISYSNKIFNILQKARLKAQRQMQANAAPQESVR